MPDAFFASDKKRKRSNRPSRGGGRSGGDRGGPSSMPRVSKSRVQAAKDEELDSEGEMGGDIDDMDFQRDRAPITLDDDEFVDANETAAEKRVRLARGYLDKVAAEVAEEHAEGEFDAADIDRELIASRLKQEVDEAEGRIHRFYTRATAASTRLKTTQNVPTSAALTPSSAFISTKSGQIFRFDRAALKPTPIRASQPEDPKAPPAGHKGDILDIAASEDGKWLVTGGRDKIVGVWDVSGDEGKWVAGMRGHKDAVTSVVYPPLANSSGHVLTASLSRHLTLHSLSTLSAIDTFFGHQDGITSVSALKPTAAVTAGTSDRTCRWWKVEEEVQLVLRGGGRTRTNAETPGGDGSVREFYEGSVDVVCVLDDSHFISGGNSGTLALWSTGKKKPIFSVPFAHGLDAESHNLLPRDADNKTGASPRWITAVAAIRGTNIFASGSWDGRIRLWALDEQLRGFKPAGEIPLKGNAFVNAIEMLANPADQSTATLVAALGREHRLGRWVSNKGVANGLFTAEVSLGKQEQADVNMDEA